MTAEAPEPPPSAAVPAGFAGEPGRWPAVVLVAASLLGAVVGVTAIPAAAPALAALTAAELAVTALGLRAARYPVAWAVAVALVSLGATLLDARLAELAWYGSIPWIGVATAIATLVLYRHCRDRLPIAVGTTALVVGSVGTVSISARNGVPVATAAVAASVPYLVGMLLAGLRHLRDARDDRTRRPRLALDTDTDGGDTHTGRRALTIVALRADEMVASTTDPDARRAASDLRDLATRALHGTDDGASVTRIELHRSPGPAGPEPAADAVMPPLADREQEILRLVATGASNAAIGRSLYLSEATVKQYVSRLMRRFERDNRTQLALLAARWFDR